MCYKWNSSLMARTCAWNVALWQSVLFRFELADGEEKIAKHAKGELKNDSTGGSIQLSLLRLDHHRLTSRSVITR